MACEYTRDCPKQNQRKLKRVKPSRVISCANMACPVGRVISISEYKGAEHFLRDLGEDGYVIKANGLMGGKGVKVAGEHLHSFEEALDFCHQVQATNQIFVIEEKLIGQEFSLMVLRWQASHHHALCARS